MQSIFVLLAVIGFTYGNASRTKLFKVKFTPTVVGEWRVPVTVKDAKADYVKLSPHEEFSLVDIYCLPGDPRACPMYDTHGDFCGFRLGIPIKGLDAKSPGKMDYDYSKISCFKKGKAYDMDIYYTDFIFMNPDHLKSKGSSINEDGDSVWFKIDGKWTHIPHKEEDIAKMPGFVKQNCYTGMGQHYFYKLDENTPCSEIIPFFSMYNKGKFVGCGLVSFGSMTPGSQRVWWETIKKQFIKAILSHHGDCLPEYLDKYGGISMHMYMSDEPITCPKPK